MIPRRILAYGEDPFVISTRAMILQRAGYEVVHTTRSSDLVPLLHGIAFDMLLLGDSLRTYENVLLAERLREQFPKLIIMMVQDEKEDRDQWSTAFVSSNPEQMLLAIRMVFEEHYRKPMVTAASSTSAKAISTAAGS
jgi:CheY-like chemotaxis protein